eukprot:gnl/TRDRNA2_/TRDRNA2_183259_c0_seq1.p1 gnl/TRDRNA2_/TRDRNA2_183259_c0~~gnl/TRDRNA2_/TRDRNA2_183259_c0_seq1.p1  ORF type:complete len:252 (+),score=34.65 gnl/TRDRNA2_/TRDRNA2_183259_c0_seq1:74-829(+)
MSSGPSCLALRQGGAGGALRYKDGHTVVVRKSGAGAPPPAWAKKTTWEGAFSEFGHIMRIDIPPGQAEAHIEFDDERDAEDAVMEMNGKKVSGQAVVVQRASRADSGVGGAGIQGRVVQMAHQYGLDEAATTRLVSVFTERVTRLGCDLNTDINEFSSHLAASNKPSALVCAKLADLREGKPIGPCKYTKGVEQNRDGRRPAEGRPREEVKHAEDQRERRERSRERERKSGNERRGAGYDRERRRERSRSR